MKLSILDIMRATAYCYGLGVQDLRGPCRERGSVWPRQLAMVLAREHTGQSMPVIGRAFGGRHHTTVIHAIEEAGPGTERWESVVDARKAIIKLATVYRDQRLAREQGWITRLLAGEVIFDAQEQVISRLALESARDARGRAVGRNILVTERSLPPGQRRPRRALPSDLTPPSQARLMGARA